MKERFKLEVDNTDIRETNLETTDRLFYEREILRNSWKS